MSKIKWKKAQQSVLEDSGNMLVSASAGTGKTTVMLEKVMRLVESGHNLDRFLIITFSNASAAEMKEKLIKKILEKLREKDSDKKHLKKQLDLIDFSNISTIDSFFYNIFKMFYALIGYDPAFEVADEKEAGMLFNESIDQIIEKYLHQKDDDFFFLVERFIKSRDISPLKKAIRDMFSFMNKQKNPEQFQLKAYDVLSFDLDKNPAILFYMNYHKKMFRRFSEELKNLLVELEKSTPLLYSLYKDYIKEIINCLYTIYSKDNFKDFSFVINEIKISNKPRKPKDLFGEQAEKNDKITAVTGYTKEYIKGIKKELNENSVDSKHLADSVKDVKKLLEIVFEVKQRYQQLKQKRKKLDFDDLSLISLKIVNIESCRQKIKDSFDFIFVDEYQDTNYIQEEIINLCSKQNNLFMVGDPKQSIYQFRDAEPQIFLNRYNIYENDDRIGKNKNLNDNFRSDKRILNFVNMVFCEIMNEDFGGVDYRNKALLISAEPFPEVSDSPFVEIMQYKNTKEQLQTKRVYSVKEDTKDTIKKDIQSVYIADKISSFVGKKYIYDKDKKQKRLVEYKDIAILMYKRDDKIIKELRARQIPFFASGFNKDKEYEIELMVNYLRLINNMADDIVLTSVMLSPIYSFSPKELLEIRKNSDKDMFWEAILDYKGNQTIELKIETLLFDLDRYAKMSSYTSVYELMLTILTQVFDACLLKKGEDAIGKVNNFINSVKGREFARNITSFLEYYDNAVQENYELSTMDNAVKITTIHKSKGLEFPLVFVADAHKGLDNRLTSDKDLFADSDFGVAVKHFDTANKTKSHTLLTKSFLLKSQCREKEELMRLMYVAFTRAQNHLFISGQQAEKQTLFTEGAQNFMQWLCYAGEKNPDIKNYFIKEDISFEQRFLDNADIVIEENVDLRGLDFDYSYDTATTVPLKYSVTSLRDFQEEFEEERLQKSSYLTEEQRIEKGVFYHKVLELIDFEKRDKEQIRKQLKEFCNNGLLDHALLQSVDINLIENILKNPIIEYALKNKYYKEKPFMLYVPMNEILDNDCKDKVLVQGVIDLLILGEKNYIVDFKVTQNQNPEIIKRYEKQLWLYTKAAEELMNIKIEKAYIYLINQNKLVSH